MSQAPCTLPEEMVYWGDFMKARHFFRPALQMFDFKGTAGQAEYLRYTAGTWLVTAFLALALFGLFTFEPWKPLTHDELLRLKAHRWGTRSTRFATPLTGPAQDDPAARSTNSWVTCSF
ncbi:hypothetical protein QFZ35_003238 [Arthrobacter ulcerisalmonis]|nr:hypothetical protein [Arthrobacter ulcerisalmonis]